LKPVAAWARPFDDPVLLSGGRKLVTLRDAADYIMKLPKAEQNLEAWQTAVEALIMAAEDRGSLMHARIGMLRLSIGMSNWCLINRAKTRIGESTN